MRQYPTTPSLSSVTPGKSLREHELVEVVDEADRPLAVMNLARVHAQALAHRSVLVTLFDVKGRIYLQKRATDKDLYPGHWDVSASGHVRAGESREEAALRELNEELGISLNRLRRLSTVPAGPRTGYEFVTLFTAGRVKTTPRPNPAEVSEGFFFDSGELSCLVTQFRELLTPGLIHFYEQGILSPEAG